LVRPGTLAFTGSIGATGRHSHHAVQILVADSPITVLDDAGDRHTGTQVIVPADSPHAIETGTAEAILIFFDPDTNVGVAAGRRARARGWASGPNLGQIAETGTSLTAAVDALTLALVSGDDNARLSSRHPQVLATLELLPGLVANGRVSTRDVAARVGISASRLTHLFSAQVGLPLRRHILWLRLTIAITEVAAGRDLTAAAHAAGFADSAHLTRTCRATFGLPPSALNRNMAWDIEYPAPCHSVTLRSNDIREL
jgi:AraC-like DNA-binding protein